MTNKEAIEILKKLPNICGQGTAIQLAIKALEEIDKWKVAYDIACYACVKDTPYDSLACSECKHFNDDCGKSVIKQKSELISSLASH